MRVDDGGGKDLARRVDDRTLDAVAVARVQAQRRALARRGRQQNIAQVGRENLERAFLRLLFQAHAHVEARGDGEFGAPAPVDDVGKPAGGVNV